MQSGLKMKNSANKKINILGGGSSSRSISTIKQNSKKLIFLFRELGNCPMAAHRLHFFKRILAHIASAEKSGSLSIM